MLKTPSLHLAAKKDKCIKCRRYSKACPMSLNVMGMVQKGNIKNTECIICGECCSACDAEVLRRKFGNGTATVKIERSGKL